MITKLCVTLFAGDKAEPWYPDDALPVEGTNGALWTYGAYCTSGDEWNVAHGPTGRRVCGCFISRREAVAFCKRLWKMLPHDSRESWCTAMPDDEARKCTPIEARAYVHEVGEKNAIRASLRSDE